jgi:hypothetical protein
MKEKDGRGLIFKFNASRHWKDAQHLRSELLTRVYRVSTSSLGLMWRPHGMDCKQVINLLLLLGPDRSFNGHRDKENGGKNRI